MSKATGVKAMDCTTSTHHFRPGKKTSFSPHSMSILSVLVIGAFVCASCNHEDPNRPEEIGQSEVENEPTAAQIKGVSAFVDKMLYSSGENIIITVNNNSEESIFSHIGSGTPVYAIKHIQKRTADGSWQNLYAQCQPPHCFSDTDAPAEINPGESASFKWDPLRFLNGTRDAAPLESGQYRVTILYEDSQKTQWKTTNTNEFRIG